MKKVSWLLLLSWFLGYSAVMESRFLGHVEVEQLNGYWRLLAPLRYQSERHGLIEVPCGFITDFASVPRLPFVYWWTGNTAHAAAVVHDYLYQTHRLPQHENIDRATADGVFYEAMGAHGEPGWRRWLMWAGVRLGGVKPWSTGPTRFSDFRNHLVCG